MCLLSRPNRNDITGRVISDNREIAGRIIKSRGAGFIAGVWNAVLDGLFYRAGW